MSIAHAQTATAHNAASASITASFGLSSVNGHLLVAAVAGYNGIGGELSLSVSDNAGNTWSLVASQLGSTNRYGVWLFAAANITGRSFPTVTATDSGSSASASSLTLTASEFSGVATASPLDQTATNFSASTSSNPTSGSITTALAGELYYALVAQEDNFEVITAPGGWTDRGNLNAVNVFSDAASLGDSSSEPAGTYSATWTFSTASRYAALIASFKAAAAPPAGRLFRPSNLAGLGAGGPNFLDPLQCMRTGGYHGFRAYRVLPLLDPRAAARAARRTPLCRAASGIRDAPCS